MVFDTVVDVFVKTSAAEFQSGISIFHISHIRIWILSEYPFFDDEDKWLFYIKYWKGRDFNENFEKKGLGLGLRVSV